MVNTRELSKAAVLAALYNASKPQGLGFLQFDPTPMTEEEAEKFLKQSTYFDYLKGRVMKVELKNDDGFEEWLYDRDNGPGAAQRAINDLRKPKQETPKWRPVPTIHSLAALTSELTDRGYEVWANNENNGGMKLRVQKGDFAMVRTIGLDAVLEEAARTHCYTQILEDVERGFSEVSIDENL